MSNKNKSPRRQGREKAFRVLYGCNFTPVEKTEYVRITFENFLSAAASGNQKANSFAWELISGVIEKETELDSLIDKHSQNWRFERIARIELTILRLALYEMLYRQDVPVKVAINEGIELCKKYGDSKSGRFVNGILDAVAKKILEGGDQDSEGFLHQELPLQE